MKGSSHARQKREACWRRQTEILATGGLRGPGGGEKWRGEIDEGGAGQQHLLVCLRLNCGPQKMSCSHQTAEPWAREPRGEEAPWSLDVGPHKGGNTGDRGQTCRVSKLCSMSLEGLTVGISWDLSSSCSGDFDSHVERRDRIEGSARLSDQPSLFRRARVREAVVRKGGNAHGCTKLCTTCLFQIIPLKAKAAAQVRSSHASKWLFVCVLRLICRKMAD